MYLWACFLLLDLKCSRSACVGAASSRKKMMVQQTSTLYEPMTGSLNKHPLPFPHLHSVIQQSRTHRQTQPQAYRDTHTQLCLYDQLLVLQSQKYYKQWLIPRRLKAWKAKNRNINFLSLGAIMKGCVCIRWLQKNESILSTINRLVVPLLMPRVIILLDAWTDSNLACASPVMSVWNRVQVNNLAG